MFFSFFDFTPSTFSAFFGELLTFSLFCAFGPSISFISKAELLMFLIFLPFNQHNDSELFTIIPF